jgi:hypothetical protein
MFDTRRTEDYDPTQAVDRYLNLLQVAAAAKGAGGWVPGQAGTMAWFRPVRPAWVGGVGWGAGPGLWAW